MRVHIYPLKRGFDLLLVFFLTEHLTKKKKKTMVSSSRFNIHFLFN